ncbi:MAG: type II secretion system protein [Thermovirgaceae bacterium]|nr:type II secretion system protein [Synergistales bacterium]
MKSSQRRNMNRLKGFTLTEILVAVLIMAIVAGSVMMLGYTYFKHFEQANEITIAKDRATMVLTYLERRILHTGLGMPVSADDFIDGFAGLLTGDLDGWDLPIYSPELDNSSSILQIAYAQPTRIYTIESADVGLTDVPVRVSDTIDGFIDSDISTKGWVVFPSVTMPFRIKDVVESAGSVTITLFAKELDDNNRPWRLPLNDELHVIRFMKATVADEKFKIEEHTLGGGLQPIVEGIIGCNFSLHENKVLMVSILARGSKKYSSFVSPADIPGWDGVVDNESRKYYLVVLNKGWRIRN